MTINLKFRRCGGIFPKKLCCCWTMQQIGPLTIHTHRYVSIVIPKIPKIQLKFDKHESTKKKRTTMKFDQEHNLNTRIYFQYQTVAHLKVETLKAHTWSYFEKHKQLPSCHLPLKESKLIFSQFYFTSLYFPFFSSQFKLLSSIQMDH